jgi:hypothetical protein
LTRGRHGATDKRSATMVKLASILGQIGAGAGAVSAFWLDVTSAQYHGGKADFAAWGLGLFIVAALPLWLAARNVDAHPRLVALAFVACGIWLAVPSVWGLIEPSLFIAPAYMVEPTRAPEGIRLACTFVLTSGVLLLTAALFAFRAGGAPAHGRSWARTS